MPRKKKTQKKKTRKTKKRKFSILKALFVFGFLGAIAAGVIVLGSYVYIDQKVKTILERPWSGHSAAIFTLYDKISSSEINSIEALEEQLANRKYSKVDRPPRNPGEYFIDQEKIEIYNREFLTTSGNFEAPRIHTILLPQEDQELPPERKIVLLEPRKLASLSGGDSRANRYKILKEFPQSLIDAVLITEDERFYKHKGIDPIGIMRAMLTNLANLAWVQGGSTLTQQLAKNVIFSPKKTLKRKYLEALAAVSIEQRLSKEKILELYLNEVYLGQEGSIAIHGAATAAKSFFNKDVSKLRIDESALLAGIVKAPSFYSPVRNRERAKERRNLILDKMYKAEKISLSELQSAKTRKIRINRKRFFKSEAPFFVQNLRKHLQEEVNIEAISQPRVRVHTGLSYELQRCGEKAITEGLEELEATYPSLKREKNKLEAGLVAIETYSGLIKAWVGGRDYSENQFDHVAQAKRQIGSTVKPFVYITALDYSLNDYRVATPITILTDEPLEIESSNPNDPWTPKNYDGDFRGAVTLRYALEKSLNIPAVYIGQRVGPDKVANTLEQFAVLDNALSVPSITLGAQETSLLRLTAAYAALANGGVYVKPRYYVSITGYDYSVVNESPIVERRVANEDATYVLTNILQGVIQRGTGVKVRSLGYTYPVAGKTGTTNEARDAWFVGYSPEMAAGVWIGFDDNAKVGLPGSAAAAPIWTKFMQCAANFNQPKGFSIPRGVVFLNIDSRTGRRHNKRCWGDAAKEVFVRGTEPLLYCNEKPSEPKLIGPAPRPKRQERKGILDLLFG